MQLDIFNDSRDVMLRNGVLSALAQQDESSAQAAWRTLLTLTEPVAQRLKDQFDARFEPEDEGADDSLDLAGFPAWVLTEQPQYLGDLALAQPGQHSAPEQAMRLLVNLLGLERQGRQHDVVACRKRLRDLNSWVNGV